MHPKKTESLFPALRSIVAIGLCAALGLLSACSTEEGVIFKEQGRFSLSISTLPTFTMADAVTYQPEIALPSTADYALTLSHGDEKHTWASVADVNPLETYYAGSYTATLQSTGTPSFGGTTTFDITAGKTTTVSVDCSPTQALIHLTDNSNESPYTIVSTLCQSAWAQYVELLPNADNYVEPGQQTILATLADSSGKERTLSTGYTPVIDAAHGIELNINLDGRTLQTGTARRTITNAVFNAEPPVATAQGFTPGVTVNATEGITLENDLVMTITSEVELAHAWLTLQSPIVSIIRSDSRVDLLNLTDSQRQMLEKNKLQFIVTDNNTRLTVNYSDVIEQLASYTSALSTFTLVGETVDGVCSEPISLIVNTDIVTFQLVETTPAIIGTNIAGISLRSDVSNVERDDFTVVTASGVKCPITDWQVVNDIVIIGFEVPEGSEDINVTLNYLGLPRLSAVIKRTAPATTITADAFATSAVLQFDTDSPEATKAMIKLAKVYVDNSPAAVAMRNEDAGYIVINGLKADTKYTVKIAAGVTANAGSVTFTTEKTLQLPDPSFEDWRDLIKYPHLEAGGRYSATTVPLYNRQNYTDVDVKWIKTRWTSVNDKTFNITSKRHNTWYMQPSTAIVYEPQAGYKAMCLTSVGWDHDGPAIADYVQLPGQNLPYNPNVPHIAHRSAGRLFLGEYRYDSASGNEVHNEGIAFTSRPSSINGFYKYLPDLTDTSDMGLVVVQVLGIDSKGNEITIASGEARLINSPDYKAFNVPLTYDHIGIRASRLCVMFASTYRIGNQEYEDANVPVTPHLDSSTLTGSRLYIDNLSLTY